MENILYYELKQALTDIKENAKDKTYSLEQLEQDKKDTIAAVLAIQQLTNIARKEGLLSLEESAGYIQNDRFREYLKRLIILVVDGTEPEFVKTIGWNYHLSRMTTGYEAVIDIILLTGMLRLQAGENPLVTLEFHKTMLPQELEDEFNETNHTISDEDKPILFLTQKENKDIRDFIDDGYFWDDELDGVIPNLLNFMLNTISNRGVQRILKDVEKRDLAVALKGLNCTSRKILLRNMSQRVAYYIVNESTDIGKMKKNEVILIILKIINIIVKLVGTGQLRVYCHDQISELVKLINDNIPLGAANQNQKEKILNLYSNIMITPTDIM